MTLILKRVLLRKDKSRREAIDLFLRQHQLSLEADCEMAIIAEYRRRLVGCGAIAGNVLKCIAIDPSLQGEGLSLKLLTELLTLAYELGRSELFLFTKPCNAALFAGAGFWPAAGRAISGGCAAAGAMSCTCCASAGTAANTASAARLTRRAWPARVGV